jgi:hypothetical protein
MKIINNHGWLEFLKGFPWYKGENNYPMRAYSEYMPPARNGISPYTGEIDSRVFENQDEYGWKISEFEEEYQLRPGLEETGKQILEHILQMRSGKFPAHLAGHKQKNLINNIFWPEELILHSGLPEKERYVSLLPLALSKTKDDKGRVRWTFFGASEQGPEKAFWKSFYETPGKEVPVSVFLSLMQWILKNAYGIPIENEEHLKNLGFRILPAGDFYPFAYWKMETLPSWTRDFLIKDEDDFSHINYLLTFRPFGKLPSSIKERYLTGELALLPFPGSMMLWGSPDYIKLQKKQYNAIQIPMLGLVKRNEHVHGIRVPQSGWMHEPKFPGEKANILEHFIVNTYIRTNRWDRVHRNEDALLISKEVDPMAQTLFSTNLKSLDLYNKPMARNSQLLHESLELLLDGPRADRKAVGEAELKVVDGGLFRYRFYFPPMQAGLYETWWHRPLVGCLSKESNEIIISNDVITGYLTGYDTNKPDPACAIELWPRFVRRELLLSILHNFDPAHDHYLHQTPLNLLALFDSWEQLGNRPIDREFARHLVRIPKDVSLEEWLESFPGRSKDQEKAKSIRTAVASILRPSSGNDEIPEFLTYGDTATRAYEEAYWNQIFFLAHGKFLNKDNADVVQDPPTLKHIIHPHRDLEKLGDYLLNRYQEEIRSAVMEKKAEVGELPFKWETDFEFQDYGGWKANQEGSASERNILVIIPGKNRREAVIMADHYDTAYMEDVYGSSGESAGARLSAAGADDNHSATSTLLLAAPIYLRMAKEGLLERDIWLLHLTGEEFPSDCMGARNFCQHVIQETLQLHRSDGTIRDLSGINITGVVLMDMIAHNRDTGRDIFQIAPGNSIASLRLSTHAYQACRSWNTHAEKWNESPDRKGCERGQRTTDGVTIPTKALHLRPDGEIRTWEDPHSTLYNTDGIIFSDTGIPILLFMENYDINRKGYHDTHDTMENIDLDYGAAISAIAIETVARIATSGNPKALPDQ